MFSSIRLIKTFSKEKKAESDIAEAITENNRAFNEQAVLNSFHRHVMAAMPSAAKFFVLAMGSYWVIEGKWTLGSLLAFLTYLSFVYGPVTYLASSANQLQSTRAALERVTALLDAVPEDNVQTGLEVTSLNGEVELKDVSFEYEVGKPVLSGVSFHTTVGEH